MLPGMIEKISLKIPVFILSIWISSLSLSGQENHNKEQQVKISCPEKRWAVLHPFISKKTYILTIEVLQTADSLKVAETMDKDINGGQVDAFKHAYWMAVLVQHIKWRKAIKLGKAHEKGNYRSYKKYRRKGMYSTHDKIASEMDLHNNQIGVEIGLDLKNKELLSIQQAVIDSIQAGKMKIIKKNAAGQYLDCEGNVIPEETLIGEWENNKCLIPSNKVSANSSRMIDN